MRGDFKSRLDISRSSQPENTRILGRCTAKKKKPGWRWRDPTNKGNGVRIDKGDADSSFPSQQVDHVLIRKAGQVIGKNGQPIAGSIKNSPTEAHIPLDEWLQWQTWYAL